MKVLTIVIPAYNIEKYVDSVLSSVLLPEIENMVEVLLVNDGSKDRTAELAARYQTDYSNLRVITKENGGHGSVVNRGIQEASGKYIKILDGDDTFNREAYLAMVHIMEIIDADMILTSYDKVNATTGKKRHIKYTDINPGQIYQFREISDKLGRIYMQGVTYRTEILRHNQISMTEKCYYDDFEFTFFPLPYIKTVYYIDLPVYQYLVGQQEQSINAKKSFQNLNMFYKILDDSLLFWNSRQADTVKLNMIKKYNICGLINNIANVYIRNAFDGGNYRTFKEAWLDLEAKYPAEVGETIDNFKHIRIAKTSKMSYYCIVLLFFLYKKMEGFWCNE